MVSNAAEIGWKHAGEWVAIICLIGSAGLALFAAWLALPAHFSRGNSPDLLLVFHLAVVQVAIAFLGLIALVLHRRRYILAAWWAHADPRRQAGALLLVLVTIEICLAAGFWFTQGRGVDQLGYLRSLFYLGGERNLPALFSALQLVLAGVLAYQCGRARAGASAARWTWWISSAVCLYLGFDEFFMLHERVGDWATASGWFGAPGRNVISFGHWQVYTWTVVFTPIAAMLGPALAIKFRRMLPIRTFGILVLSGLAFLWGAIGMEDIQSHEIATGLIERGSLPAQFFMFVEEMLEMFGASLAVYVFAYTLLDARVRT
jgi:hypothetical protein